MIGWQTFVIYQGHHGDHGAARADVVLPGAAYTEKDAIYVNTEGRPQLAKRAASPPGEAREDWKIIRALSAQLGVKLAYDTSCAIAPAHRAGMAASGGYQCHQAREVGGVRREGQASERQVPLPMKNFYLANAICRASETMRKCSASLLEKEQFAEAAE
jgi:NADH-quinone oxidoreductase subunit G